MKIRLGDLRKIIKEELSHTMLESASLTPRSFAEEEFLRLVKNASEDVVLEVQRAWDDLKSGADFSQVAMDLYDSTGFRIDSLGRRYRDGSVARGGPFEKAMAEINPDSVKKSVSEVQGSSWPNDAIVQFAASKRAARNAPRPQDPRPPWPFDPSYPGKREYDERTGKWKMVDSDPISGRSYVE